MLTEKNVFHLDRKTVFHLDIYIVCLYTLATINTMILFAEVQSNRLGTNCIIGCEIAYFFEPRSYFEFEDLNLTESETI